MFLNSIVSVETEEFVNKTIVLPNINNLYKLLNYSNEESPVLELNQNTICYNSPGAKFTLHLADSSIQASVVNIFEKLSKLEVTSTFTIGYSEIQNLVSAFSINPELIKIYLTQEDKKIYATLTDKNDMNSDSITLLLSELEEFVDLFNSRSYILNVEYFKLLKQIKADNYLLYVYNKPLIKTSIVTDTVNLDYISSLYAE